MSPTSHVNAVEGRGDFRLTIYLPYLWVLCVYVYG